MASNPLRSIKLSVFGKTLAMIVLLTVIVAGSITYCAANLLREVGLEGFKPSPMTTRSAPRAKWPVP